MLKRKKLAVVIGGSRGIGQATCLRLAADYENLAIIFKSNTEAAEATAEQIRGQGCRAILARVNVSDGAAVDEEFSRLKGEFGEVDAVVHAAGAETAWKPLRELTLGEWDAFLASDLTGFFNVARAAVRIMHVQNSGVIVVVTSIAAKSGAPHSAQTASAKAGVESLVRVIAREEGRYGIRINAVQPGLTQTDMGTLAIENWGTEQTKKILAQSALRRIGSPDEVAAAISFLVSDDASYITGRVLPVDGGQFISA